MKKVRETLTMRQQAFVNAYLLCANASQAALEAGYSPKHSGKIAYKLLNHPLIKESVEKCRAKSVQLCSVTFDDKVKFLWDLANECRDTQDKSVCVKAIAEINKMIGHYAPERHYNENLNVNAELKDIQEIRKMYEKDM